MRSHDVIVFCVRIALSAKTYIKNDEQATASSIEKHLGRLEALVKFQSLGVMFKRYTQIQSPYVVIGPYPSPIPIKGYPISQVTTSPDVTGISQVTSTF